MGSFPEYCAETAAKIREAPPSRTPSLVATVFGDVIEAHGGEVWLGSLARLLAPLGISERLVRTSVYRLTRDGFLTGTKVGRRSYYRVSEQAGADVQRLDRRIYHASDPRWDGQWRLVFTGTQGIEPPQRAELRKRLSWLGFGIIAPNVYGHPTAPLEPVWRLFETMNVADKAVVMKATNFDREHGLTTREMAAQCFALEPLGRNYQAFVARFGPVAGALADGGKQDEKGPEHCFVLRTMLIHDYRRILLKDPGLPRALLPEPWPALEARRLCGEIYRAVEAPSERYIRAVCEDRTGPFRATASGHRGRFRNVQRP